MTQPSAQEETARFPSVSAHVSGGGQRPTETRSAHCLVFRFVLVVCDTRTKQARQRHRIGPNIHRRHRWAGSDRGDTEEYDGATCDNRVASAGPSDHSARISDTGERPFIPRIVEGEQRAPIDLHDRDLRAPRSGDRRNDRLRWLAGGWWGSGCGCRRWQGGGPPGGPQFPEMRYGRASGRVYPLLHRCPRCHPSGRAGQALGVSHERVLG